MLLANAFEATAQSAPGGRDRFRQFAPSVSVPRPTLMSAAMWNRVDGRPDCLQLIGQIGRGEQLDPIRTSGQNAERPV